MNNVIEMMKTTLPRYTVIQPSSGKTLSFRPFTVKEEKVLLMANTTGTYEDFLQTLAKIIDSCFDLSIPALKLPLFDIEYFFIKLRAKSVGEIVDSTILCPVTNEQVPLNINLEIVEPKYNENHKKEIQISPTILIKMRYPTLENMIARNGKTYDYYDLIIECIDEIQTPNELIEARTASKENIQEFVDLLTKEQFKKIIDFFKTMPQIEQEITYTSSNKERTLVLRGMKDFFQ